MGEEERAVPEKAVELRDFSQPRRLSLAQQQSIKLAIEGCLPQIKSELTRWLRDETTAADASDHHSIVGDE